MVTLTLGENRLDPLQLDGAQIGKLLACLFIQPALTNDETDQVSTAAEIKFRHGA